MDWREEEKQDFGVMLLLNKRDHRLRLFVYNCREGKEAGAAGYCLPYAYLTLFDEQLEPVLISKGYQTTTLREWLAEVACLMLVHRAGMNLEAVRELVLRRLLAERSHLFFMEGPGMNRAHR